MSNSSAQTGYGVVNGLKMYYEIHGAGEPLVLLHGGFMFIDALYPLLPALAATRQVIAIELEGHGHTDALDRPLDYEQFADDVVGLLAQLGIKQADFLGYSMGGITSLRIGMKYPEIVRKLVIVSAPYSIEGFYPEVAAQWPNMSPEGFAGSPIVDAYQKYSPNPQHFPEFIGKMRNLMLGFKGWSESEIQKIKAPVLFVLGDNDLIRPESNLTMVRLLGGGKANVFGMDPTPRAQLAILPGTTHFSIVYNLDLLMPVVTPFLAASEVETQVTRGVM